MATDIAAEAQDLYHYAAALLQRRLPGALPTLRGESVFVGDACYSDAELARLARAAGAKGRSYVAVARSALAIAELCGAAHGFDPFTGEDTPQ